MFKKSSILVSLALALTLTACDTDEIVDNLTDDITDAVTDAATDAATDTANDAFNIGLVSGIYDTSTDDDVSYVYISGEGNITVYDYQSDPAAVDAGLDQACYIYATEPSQMNSSLHDNEITYDSAESKYSILIEDDALTFLYNVSDGMRTFSYLTLTSDEVFTFSNSDINIRLGGDGYRQSTSLDVDDFEADICD